jgi:hypothetical protein
MINLKNKKISLISLSQSSLNFIFLLNIYFFLFILSLAFVPFFGFEKIFGIFLIPLTTPWTLLFLFLLFIFLVFIILKYKEIFIDLNNKSIILRPWLPFKKEKIINFSEMNKIIRYKNYFNARKVGPVSHVVDFALSVFVFLVLKDRDNKVKLDKYNKVALVTKTEKITVFMNDDSFEKFKDSFSNKLFLEIDKSKAKYYKYYSILFALLGVVIISIVVYYSLIVQ